MRWLVKKTIARKVFARNLEDTSLFPLYRGSPLGDGKGQLKIKNNFTANSSIG